jgi:Transposase DDE domain
MRSSTQCCTSSRAAASGACFLKDFPNGARCIRISPSGAQPVRTSERSVASLKKSVGAAREKLGQNAMTSFLIADAQSVKNTDNAEQKRYDAGKKVSGIKRHIAVNTQGLPHAVAVTAAEVTDRNGALAAIDRCNPNLERVESMLVDVGYSGQPFADGVMERLKATVQVVKRNELHAFAVLPKR